MTTPTEDRAIRAVLAALGQNPRLLDGYALKGGTALQRFYSSPRASVDIDLSARTPVVTEGNPLDRVQGAALLDTFCADLDEALEQVQGSFSFSAMRVQRARLEPGSRDPMSRPSFDVRVGYSSVSTRGPFSSVVKLDVALYETVCGVVVRSLPDVEIPDGEITVSALDDIMAEKLRALLQQVTRNRARPGDVYDLWFFITKARRLLSTERIRDFLHIKCTAHEGLDPVTRQHFAHPEVRARAQRGYDDIQGRLPQGHRLPPFDQAFGVVSRFVDALGLPEGPDWVYETDPSRSSRMPTG